MSRTGRAAVAAAVFSVLAALVTPGSAHAADVPTVTITAPAAGQHVSGTVQITAHGQIPAALDDTAFNISLYVDAQLVGESGTVDCGRQIDDHQCDASFAWDTTGLSGPHSLQVKFETANTSVNSPLITVVTTNPVPTVTITSPTSGAVLTGASTVHAHGSIPAGLSSTAWEITLIVDGLVLSSDESPASCGGQIDDHQCEVSIPWRYEEVSGRHTLQARFETTTDSVLSPVVTVYVRTAVAVSLTLPTVRTGHQATGRGRVTSTSSGEAIPFARVSLRLVPAAGAARTLTVTSSASGSFTWKYTPKYKTTVTATASAGLWWLGGSRSAISPVTAVSRCTWTRSVSYKRKATGVCRLLNPPASARVVLQVFSGGAWVAVTGTKTVRKAKAPFWVGAQDRGSAKFRIVFFDSRLYSTTTSPVMRIGFT